MAQGTQENCFLDLPGIAGKSTTSGFEKKIVVQSVSYGIHQAGEFDDAGSKNARITTFSDLTVVKEMDQSSPALARSCAEKKTFPSATLTFVDGSNKEYFKVTLTDVMLSSVNVGYHTGETKPTETITLCYRKAEWKRGTEVASYDLKQNVGA
jgi:type VI secretion system secreted protein Hcp